MEQIIKNRYKIIRSIGAGGMSEVFLAHDELLDRNVAVKRLRDQFASDKELLNQFKREAKSAAQLVHPNIIGIFDVIDDEQDQYIVMEYVEGRTLKEILKDYRVEPRAALQITMQLADALQHAHSQNVVHCDIKPQNILMNVNMIPKIGDFGIAKMVSEQTMVYTDNIMGSVHYISPEQASGEPVTFASDIYSLGIVLFEMLTGQAPFKGESPVAVAMMQVEKPLPPLQEYMETVPLNLQAVLDKMTAKKINNRYASAKELKEDLEKILNSEPLQQGDEEEWDGNTIIMEPVKAADKSTEKKGKIIAVSLDKEAMARTAKNWQENIKYRIKNFNYTFDNCVIIFTLVVCLISAIAYFFLRSSNAMTVVPNVVNMQVEEAKDKLEDDYKVEVQEESSPTVAAGLVIRQIPEEGEQRRRGSTVKIYFSVGAEKHTMPDLIDMSLVKAQQVLDELGMKVGKTERKYNRQYRIGVIIEQEPKAGEKTNENVPVNLVINEGDKQLPDLVGKQLSEVERTIRQLGLRVGEVRRVNSMDIKGTVTATYPEAGAMLPGYYPVRLTVSDGPDGSVMGAHFEYTVPGSSNEKHRIQIYKVDKRGRNLIYSSIDAGGKVIKQTIDNGGVRASIIVYCDGKQVQEDKF